MSLELILGLLAAIVAALGGAYAKGRIDKGRAEKAKDAAAYQKTMERMQDADVAPDAAAAREWLRQHKP